MSAAEFLRGSHDARASSAVELPRDGWRFPAGNPVEVVGLVDVDTPRPHGLDAAGRAGLLDAVVAELHRLVASPRGRAAAGSAACTAHVAEGHDLHHLAVAEHVQAHRFLVQDALDA